MTDRALSPVVGTALLVVLVVSLSAAVATASGAVVSVGDPPPRNADFDAPTAFSLSVSGDWLAVTYERGPALVVSDLRLVVVVDGDALKHQPPLPFFAARGFGSGPTGPFNVAGDGVWSAGETGRLRVAGTNDPVPEAGRTVTVRLYRGTSSRPLATLRAAVRT
ncbi:archaellin/type IV pilin N-terminal domain-containing protein [Halogeometricum limi]|uniref:Flagellin N-terminal-like domain-containing protein n=1 Tax=Halogeometricum limi TaxID=555875 RepID=A0A1I6FX01_9EURY|nr:archaellin/type IV pilin N-terminal domain-containing protein [Halogeometricum limi]SFR34464.1 flagellin N-terminal-like domain-containing protein [Halogeometricum limi]